MAETHLTSTETPVSQAAGDRHREDALERQIERSLPALRDAVRRHLQYHEALGDLRPREVEPDDLVIETVARAMRAREKAPARDRLYHWLLRFAYRVVEEEVKRRRKEHEHVPRSLDDPLTSHGAEHAFDEPMRRLIDVIPAGPIPEEVVVRREFQAYVERQLSYLPPGPAMALLYHDVEGMTYRQVAELFHVSEEEARHWVRLARAALADALYRDGWINVPPPARLFRPGAAPSRETRREWMMRARERNHDHNAT